MSYESARPDAFFAAAIGEEPALTADLRHEFLFSALALVQAMAQSASVSEWHRAAWRFKGLCTTFGLASLADLAERATTAPKGDPGLLRKMHVALTALARMT